MLAGLTALEDNKAIDLEAFRFDQAKSVVIGAIVGAGANPSNEHVGDCNGIRH